MVWFEGIEDLARNAKGELEVGLNKRIRPQRPIDACTQRRFCCVNESSSERIADILSARA